MQDDKHDFVLLSHPSTGTVAKASSVLQKNMKLYGPMNALDSDNALTCWNSEGSTKGKGSSFLIIDFGRVVQPVQVAIQFQAGFIAEDLAVSFMGCNVDDWIPIVEFEAEDDHEIQQFSLADGDTTDSRTTTRALKLFFDECTDFYGRIIVYKLQIWGRELGPEKSPETSSQA